MDIRVMLLCLALYGIIVGASSGNPVGQCRQINSCACLYDDGSLVDLAPLSRDDGKPHFQYIRDVSMGGNFFWNPCTPFSLFPKESACKDVAMCMISGNNGTEMYYDLGRQESATFTTSDNAGLRLVYTYIGDVKRISEIGLRCLDTFQPDKLIIQDIIQEDHYTTKYVMLLESRYACIYVPKRPTPNIMRTTIEPSPIGQCRMRNSCSCQYDDGSIVDLSPLSRHDGKPGFANVTNNDRTEFYSWNPCKPFTLNNTKCENVAICMIRRGIPSDIAYDLGDQGSAEFSEDVNGSLKLTYTANHGDYMIVTEITLQCMASSKFDFFVAEGETAESDNTILYKLILASKHACAYAPAVETTTLFVYNDTSEPTFSTTSYLTSDSTSNLPSNLPDRSNISTQRHYSTSIGSTSLTPTSPEHNFSPSMLGSAWTIIKC